MAEIEELKDKANEILAAALETAEGLADKAAEVGAPAAAKALNAAKEALSDLESQSEEALAAIEKHAKAQKKSHKGRKALGWSLAAASAGGVAYLLWRRSRPVEDPWAEEYWVDLKDEVVADDEVAAEEAILDEAIVEAIEEAIAEAEAEENK